MDRRTKQTKKKIKDAVIEKLKTDKFKDLSVTEITKTCKINRNTFYIHYRTVGDVILDIVDDVYNSFIKAFDDNSIKDYINCPRLLIYRASNVLIHDEMVSSLFYNSTFSRALTAEIENRLTLYFYQKLEEISTRDCRPSFFSIKFLISGFFSALSGWKGDPHGVTIEELTKRLEVIIRNGITFNLDSFLK